MKNKSLAWSDPSQAQCPNTPQQTTGNASAGFQMGFQQTCPTSTTAPGTYVTPTTTTVVGRGTSSSQPTSSPPPSNIITNPTDPCPDCIKNCTQTDQCNGRKYCVDDQCEELPEDVPDDCKQPVCKLGEGFDIENDDGETPPSDFNVCTDDLCSGGSPYYPANQNSCDDQLYCTSFTGIDRGSDRCEFKKCQGRKIKDRLDYKDKFGIDMSNGFPRAAKFVRDYFGQEVNIKGEIGFEKYKKCCEKKRTFFKDLKASLGISGSINLKKIPVPGLAAKIPFGIGDAGLLLSLDLNAGGNGSFSEVQCDDSYTASLEGSVSADVTLEGTVGIKAVEVGITSTTGLTAGLQGTLTKTAISGKASFDFNGLATSVYVEFWTGEYKFSASVTFIDQEHIAEIPVSIPINFNKR